MPNDELDEDTRGRWATLGYLETATDAEPQATIRPPGHGTVQRALALLAEIADRGAGAKTLELGKTLGAGAMGVVRLATQRSLDRPVAVKAIKAGAHSERNVVHLLQEAWVTGALEHPNVVPVYDIGVDADGAPQIVLKRIEGQSWGALLDDPDAVRVLARSEDVTGWHLRTLIQVCDAVHFAHSRGIIHRDLKPDNVMIGAYGEVYVVDWGIAVSTQARSGRFPLLDDATDMAGTPGYMAPEMLGRDADEPNRISARTDVYLLGAVLFQVLSGKPPHAAPNVFAMLARAQKSAPDFDTLNAPDELAAICQRAMARDPADRIASAADLGRDLQAFLDHRDSIRVTAAAEAQMETLQALLRDPGADRTTVYRMFGECRFGFRSALSSWPENLRARAGLVGATEALAQAELAAGNARGAASVLAELSSPPVELSARVEAALAADAADRAHLEWFRAEHDPQIGKSRRRMVAIVVGTPFVLAPVLRGAFFGGYDYAGLLGSLAIYLTILTVVTVKYRALLFSTSFNRRLSGSVFVILATLFLFDLGAVLVDMPIQQASTFHLAISAGLTCMAVQATEPRLWLIPIAFAAAYALALAHPPWLPYFIGAANLVTVLVAAWVWRPDRSTA